MTTDPRALTPPAGVVLDPFLGSGTTDPRALTALADVFLVDQWERLSSRYRRAHDAVAALAAAGFSIVPTGLLTEVAAERASQDARWGEQNHPNGTGTLTDKLAAVKAREVCDLAAVLGSVTWADILGEEVMEAFAESDPSLLRAELVQVAAVATAWAEAVDRAART